MDQIQPYHPPMDKQKVCWFPFKKTYERRRVGPGFDDPPNVYILDDKEGDGTDLVEVSLYPVTEFTRIEEARPQHPKAAEPIFDAPSTEPAGLLRAPSDMDHTDFNSIISEDEDDEDAIVFADLEDLKMASIEPNCLTRQFWVDEIQEGGSLACTEDFLGGGRSFSRAGQSYSSFGSQATTTLGNSTIETDSRISDDFSFSRVTTPVATGARIEVEYDFTKRNFSFSSKDTREMDPIERGTCGAIRSRSKPTLLVAKKSSSMPNSRNSQAKMKSIPEEDQASRTDASSVSNSFHSMATEKVALHAKSYTASSPKTPVSGTTELPPSMPAMKVVSPSPLGPVAHRLLCGAIPIRQPVLPEPQTTKPEKGFEEEKKTDEPSVTDIPAEPVEPPVPAKEESLYERVIWLKNSSFEKLRIPDYTKSLYPKACLQPASVPKFDESSHEPHFFVEVAATAGQLKGIRDLDEIKKVEEAVSMLNTPKEMDAARTSSLADEDSAFMDGVGCGVGKFSRLKAAKRQVPLPVELRSAAAARVKSHKSAPVSPSRGKNLSTAPPSPSRKKGMSAIASRELVTIPITPERTMSRRNGRSSGISRPRSAEDELALQGPVPSLGIYEYDDETFDSEFLADEGVAGKVPVATARKQSMSRKNSNRIQGSMEWPDESPMKVSRRVPSLEIPTTISAQKVRSADGKSPRVPSTVERNRSKEATHPYRKPNRTRDLDHTTELGQDTPEEFPTGLELARFPSLSSEDWRNTKAEKIKVTSMSSTVGDQTNDSAWIPRDERDFGRHPSRNSHEFEANFESMGEGGEFEHDDWAKTLDMDRAPSLAESFHNAVPFVPDTSDVEENFERRNASDTPGEVAVRQSRSGRNNWIDYDDESEINSEVFRQLAMEEADDDSIFNGLVERSPSGHKEGGRERDGPPLRFDKDPFVTEQVPGYDDASQESGSTENSLEQSKYTAYTSKYSKYSRGDFSKFSKRSIVTKDDITNYSDAPSITQEPFNCMDR